MFPQIFHIIYIISQIIYISSAYLTFPRFREISTPFSFHTSCCPYRPRLIVPSMVQRCVPNGSERDDIPRPWRAFNPNRRMPHYDTTPGYSEPKSRPSYSYYPYRDTYPTYNRRIPDYYTTAAYEKSSSRPSYPYYRTTYPSYHGSRMPHNYFTTPAYVESNSRPYFNDPSTYPTYLTPVIQTTPSFRSYYSTPSYDYKYNSIPSYDFENSTVDDDPSVNEIISNSTDYNITSDESNSSASKDMEFQTSTQKNNYHRYSTPSNSYYTYAYYRPSTSPPNGLYPSRVYMMGEDHLLCNMECYFKNNNWLNKDGTVKIDALKTRLIERLPNKTKDSWMDILDNIMALCQEQIIQFDRLQLEEEQPFKSNCITPSAQWYMCLEKEIIMECPTIARRNTSPWCFWIYQ